MLRQAQQPAVPEFIEGQQPLVSDLIELAKLIEGSLVRNILHHDEWLRHSFFTDPILKQKGLRFRKLFLNFSFAGD